jgi:hypothetical protein
MPSVGATQTTNSYPGVGWVESGHRTVGGVITTVWTYKGSGSSGGAKPSGGGGGYSSGSGGGGSSSGTGDAKKKADLTKQYEAMYRTLTQYQKGKLSKEAQKWIDLAVKRNMDGSTIDPVGLKALLRDMDQEGYLRTADAVKRGASYKNDLTTIFSGDIDFSDPQIKALIVKYQLADPSKTEMSAINLFKKYVVKTDAFKKKYPGFEAWFKKGGLFVDAADPIKALGTYRDRAALFTNLYQAKFGSAAAIPPELLAQAMDGDWDPQGAQWTEAINASTAWSGVTSYNDRLELFKDSWAAIFSGTEFGDIPPPQAIMDKFAKGDPSVTFDDIFQSSIKDSAAFKAAYPDFAAFEQATFKNTGQPIGTISIGDYLKRRAEYIERYRYTIGNATANPDSTLLAQAMAENWSNTQWDLTVKKLPAYTSSPAGIDEAKAKIEEQKAIEQGLASRGSAFDAYWRSMFGDSVPVDAGLRASYVNGNQGSPEDLWGSVKSTPAFQSQYANWSSFSSAQGPLADPALYKQYQKAFGDAFANAGLAAPAGFENLFFASGVNPNDLANNLNQFAQQDEAYAWQTGKQPDVAVASGISDKTAGGVLRDRMKKALAQHQAYAQSRFVTAGTDFSNDMPVKRI